ncbi:MAG TPA: T9SS type A sorting domain-containing protein [Ignavibacteria bacterium]
MKNTKKIETKSYCTGLIIAIILIILTIMNTTEVFSAWYQRNSSPLSNLGNNPVISVVDANIVFIAGGKDDNHPIIYKSIDGGITYTEVSTTGINKLIWSIYAADENTIFVATSLKNGSVEDHANVYKTTNCGLSWNLVLSSETNKSFINGIVFSKSNPLVGIVQFDPDRESSSKFYKVYKTTDGGDTWNLIEVQLSASNPSFGQYFSPFITDENFFGFGLNKSPMRIVLTKDGGSTWEYQNITTGSQDGVSSIAFNNDHQNGIAVCEKMHGKTISRTTNGGLTWSSVLMDATINDAFGIIKYIPNTSAAYLIMTTVSKTQSFKTTDNGITWTELEFSNPSNAIKMYSYDYNFTGYYSGQKIFLDDITMTAPSATGSVFGTSESPMPVTLQSFQYSVSGRNVNLRWVTNLEENNSGFEIQRSVQNENNWEKVGFVKGNGTKITPTNYTYTDSKLNAGKYQYRLKQIDYNGNYEYFTLSGFVNIANAAKHDLSQNYPNPFNPTTNIDYQISQDSKVMLKVYDISGREVMTLVNTQQKAGYYSVQFNATNLSSGNYFYKLIAGSNGNETVITKKMTVIK